MNNIFEKIVYKWMYSFIEQSECLYKTGKVRAALGQHKVSCGIFVDLQKAFDTVNHEILLDKLNYYGFRGVINNWFRSYLLDRKQKVCINGFES